MRRKREFPIKLRATPNRNFDPAFGAYKVFAGLIYNLNFDSDKRYTAHTRKDWST